MTEREILLNSMKHTDNDENAVPYTVCFDCPILEEKVNKYYGCNWQEKTRHFLHYPARIDMLLEKPVAQHYVKDAFGSVWRTDKLPWHLEKPALSGPSFRGYTFPTVNDFIAPLEEINISKLYRESCEEYPNLFRVISMGWGIFENTWRIRGFEETMCDIAAEKNFYAEFVGRIADIYAGVVDYCAQFDADAILFGDDWGSQTGVIIGPESWRKFIKPAWKRVYGKVHAQGKYAISHCCGSAYDIIPDAIEIGLDMLESVQPEAYGMDPFKLKAEFGDKLSFWGTLGSQSVIPFRKPDEIKSHIRRLKKEMSVNGGYILAPAKPFQPETPLENAIAVIDAMIEN